MLRTKVQRTGWWLFRYRSFIPFVLLPLLLFETCRNAERLASFERLGFAWGFICAGVALVGAVVRALVAGYAPVGTSGRSTKRLVAVTLNTTGLYSTTRNPLYFGNLVGTMGVVMAARSWELLILTFLLFLLYYGLIISAEEAFLKEKFGEDYTRWSAPTPWLFPRPWRWRSPETSFSWKKMIRSEPHTVSCIVSMIFVIEHARRAFIARGFELNRAWAIIWAVTALLYVAFVIVKKKTRLLNVS